MKEGNKRAKSKTAEEEKRKITELQKNRNADLSFLNIDRPAYVMEKKETKHMQMLV